MQLETQVYKRDKFSSIGRNPQKEEVGYTIYLCKVFKGKVHIEKSS